MCSGRQARGFFSLYYADWQSASILGAFWGFGLPVFLNESLLIRLFAFSLYMLFPVWTPLYNLFAFVHPEIVSVFLQLPPQRLYGYNQFC